MGDTKKGRDKQADDAEKRQREQELASELERGDEAEPPREDDEESDEDEDTADE
ncbi:hypothetical protein [Haloterrigena sp. H1]|uniref:hypothetical protein n=1 Tax=Haloterrigena sp. H1 TaxID=2552943 RepID=UPI001486E686|nr:hypothetical protein [Haloterrigena sp. H1]